jgi:hypothetical protein
MQYIFNRNSTESDNYYQSCSIDLTVGIFYIVAKMLDFYFEGPKNGANL